MQTEALAFPVFPIGTARTKEKEFMRLCTRPQIEIQEIARNGMEVRNLQKKVSNSSSNNCVDFGWNRLKVLLLKSGALVGIME